MRFPKVFKGNTARNQRKQHARELAMRGWDEEKTGTHGMEESTQRHFPLGVGHHLARAFKGHV